MDTKAAIKAQFMKEYMIKDFSVITVKGLCAATPVARTTFYSYFENTDEVKMSVEEDLISGLKAVSDEISNGNLPDMDFVLFMNGIESFIKSNWTDIYAFLVKQPNLRFIRKWKEAIKNNFKKRYPDKENIKNYDAISEILASSVLSMYTYWIEHPDTISTEEMKPLIHKLLNMLVCNI